MRASVLLHRCTQEYHGPPSEYKGYLKSALGHCRTRDAPAVGNVVEHRQLSVPDFQSLMPPALIKALAGGKEASAAEVRERVVAAESLTVPTNPGATLVVP